jgi:hypothetical protein
MDLKFAEGHEVEVADIESDTGVVDEVEVKKLQPRGTVVEARLHPPHVPLDREEDPENDNPSPHYLVRLADDRGNEREVWFTEARLTAAGVRSAVAKSAAKGDGSASPKE